MLAAARSRLRLGPNLSAEAEQSANDLENMMVCTICLHPVYYKPLDDTDQPDAFEYAFQVVFDGDLNE